MPSKEINIREGLLNNTALDVVLQEVPAGASIAALITGKGLDVVVHDVYVVLEVALAPVRRPAQVAHVVLGLLVDRLDVVPQVTRVVRPGSAETYDREKLSVNLATLT